MEGEAETRGYWETQISKAHVFYATFREHDVRPNKKRPRGSTRGKKIRHMVLIDVVNEDGIEFRGHLWLPMGKRFRKMELKRGCKVRFTAKVNRYSKLKAQKIYGGVWVYAVDNGEPVRVQLELTNINDFEVVDDYFC